MQYKIKNMSFFDITSSEGRVAFGYDQKWYDISWRKMAGCGATAAANLVSYIRASEGAKIETPVKVLDEMWEHFTPRLRGLDKIEYFESGVINLANANLQSIRPCAFKVSRRAKGIDPQVMGSFIANALKADCPVAFLNLSRGLEKKLQAWHWVTIVAFDDETFLATISDEGEKKENINLKLWLSTTKLEGGFVYIENKKD